MALLELPHTRGCLVCGRANPHGLKLSLHVDPETGIVRVDFTPQPQHIGFEGIVHGGALATVLDEAMVWAATWRGKRFCVCGEMTIRFRASAKVGQPMGITARVTSARKRLIETEAQVISAAGALLASASGKYVPLTPERHAEIMATMVDESSTRNAAALLAGAVEP